MASFSQDISKFVQRTRMSSDIVLRKLAFVAWTGVVLKSPVDTGRFRANWNLALDRVDLSVVDAPASPTTEGSPLSADEAQRVGATLRDARFGMVIYISNNLPYAEALENGSSPQAPGPGAIVGRTFEELRSYVRNMLSATEDFE